MVLELMFPILPVSLCKKCVGTKICMTMSVAFTTCILQGSDYISSLFTILGVL